MSTTLIMVSRRIPDITFACAQTLAAHAARLTMQTWHVIDDGHGTIADDDDVQCWGYPSLWSVEPEMAFSALEMDGDEEPVPDTNPDVGSTTGTYGPSPLRQPVSCITCGDDGDCPDCDARLASATTNTI